MSKYAELGLLCLLAACSSPAGNTGKGGAGGAGGLPEGGAGGKGGSGGGKGGSGGGKGGSGGGASGDAGAPMPDLAVPVDLGPPDAPSVDFCDPYGVKFCERLAGCSMPYLTGVYGDMKMCQERLTLECKTQALLPGSGLTRAGLTPCADALPTASCDDLFANSVPACQLKGTLAKGAACGVGAQCQTGFCRLPETSFCGVCDLRNAEGAVCDSDESCQFPLSCSEAGRCTKPGGEGELCNENRSCQRLLFCSSENACKRRSGEGKACNRSGDAPSQPCEIGFACRPSANGICRAIRLVGPGQSCGVPQSAGGTVTLCAGSGSCVQDTCRAPGKDGERCTISPLGDSGGCLAPALCLEGLCKLPDPASCK